MKGYERKLLSGMLVMILAFLPALGFAMYSLADVAGAQDKLNRIYTKTLLLAQTLKMQKLQQNSLMPIFVISGDQFILDQLGKSDQDFDQTLADLEVMPLGPEAAKTLATIRTLQQQLLSLDQPGIDMKRHGRAISEVDQYFCTNSAPISLRIITGLDQFVRSTSAAYETKVSDNSEIFHIISRISACASFITIVFCLVVGSLIARLVKKKRSFDQINERLAEREREISNARKEAVETVAHDLRNPLAAIIMSAELIRARSDLPSTHRVRKTIQTISAAANSMNKLIDGILDHTKIEADSLLLSKVESDIKKILENLLSRYKIIAAKKGLIVVNDVAANLPSVVIDKDRIDQVFSNLISNAIKFTPAAGTIRFTSDVRGNTLLISVCDTGPGLSDEQASHVFERYWQADDTASQGTGLGLAISREIIEAHGGTIGVKSQPGGGSTFSISLPVGEPAAAPV